MSTNAAPTPPSPADTPLALGLDVGTQGTKAVVIDPDVGGITARAGTTYELIEGLAPGAAEQHPQTWTEAVSTAIAQLAAQGVPIDRIGAVGISGQQHGLVLLDADGSVVRPAKLWCDTATADEAAELAGRFGSPVPVGFTASKARWVERHEPDAWQRTAAVMLPHDFINLRLTGRRTMEVGDASGTGFFDTAQRGFDPRLVGLTADGLADRLPGLIEAPQPAGTISAEGAAWSGLPEGALVSAGGGDNMMSAIGSGATRPGIAIVSLGTSATVFAHTDRPVVDPAGLIAPFCGSAGGWLPLLCTMNATAVVDEVRRAFGATHDELTPAAQAIAPGCDGLLWLPLLMGERVPDLPTATGTLTGMRHGWLDPARLYRAALEGVSLNLAWGVGRLRSLGVALDEVRLVGGGAANPLWRQILADTLGATIRPLAEPESAALGAAIQADWTRAVAAGRAGPHDIDRFAEPFVKPGDHTPPGPNRDVYQNLAAAYSAELARLYGVAPISTPSTVPQAVPAAAD